MSPSPFRLAKLGPGVAEQVRRVRAKGGVWRQDERARLTLNGNDAATWLHGQCSQAITDMRPGEGRTAALLNPRGALIDVFEVLCHADGFWLVVQRQSVQRLVQHFANFIFSEDVQCEVVDTEMQALCLQGPFVADVLDELSLGRELDLRDRSWIEHDGLIWVRQSLTGEAGVTVLGAEERLEDLQDLVLAQAGGKLLPYGDEAAEVMRLEAGMPDFGREVSDAHLLPETPWMETAYRPGKGCFTGQEVVERLRMKGSPKVALVALHGEEGMPAPVPGTALRVDGKKQGEFSSSTPSPTLGGRLCYAFVKRALRRPGLKFEVELDGHNWPVTLRWLPPYKHRREVALANELYDQALVCFTADQSETDPNVVPLLRRARLLDPSHEDVLELLGVALQRRGALAEATELMKRLTQENPNSLMAWVNLSRFYAEAGQIDLAEQAQGQATLLSFKSDLAARKGAVAEAQAQAAANEQRQQRMAMFQEVLAFDPDDLVALFGMGKAHLSQDEPVLAEPFFTRSVAVKPDYAAAWLELGKCQEATGDPEAAKVSYDQGIAAAAKRGELMPMRAMEQRLAALRAPSV